MFLLRGKEASQSCAELHRIIGDAIESTTQGRVSRDLIGLIHGRDAIRPLVCSCCTARMCVNFLCKFNASHSLSCN